MQQIERFRYSAATLGLAGHITLPFQEYIPAQASLQLPEAGGFVHTRVDHFNFRDILMFDRAVAFAAGSFSAKDNSFDATASVSIEGLNILNVVTADRIVARVASSHPKSGAEPSINPIGSCFVNLRICGYPVEVDVAVDTFTEFATASGFRAACEAAEPGDRVTSHLLNGGAPLPAGAIACTLVRSIEGLGDEIVRKGNAIVIPDFGVIRLGGLTIASRKRIVSMIQFELGSTPAGSGQIGGAEGNGDGN